MFPFEALYNIRTQKNLFLGLEPMRAVLKPWLDYINETHSNFTAGRFVGVRNVLHPNTSNIA